ncbi:unnamed protein product [marine sediment metagenome]|uniref:PIN domain-containing protein n=1 Tax=marine sediment metagenome TaxID=412755 RepID=X0T1I2_9ZZZZ
MTLLKVVLDTNIFISGILTSEGNPSIIIKAWKRTRKFQLFISEEIIGEVLKVMVRLNVGADIVLDWDKMIRKNASLVISDKKIKAIQKDISDNKFLECAVTAGADYIVSGDRHLKELGEFKQIKIINARQFLDILRQN